MPPHAPPFPVPDSWSRHRGAWWVGRPGMFAAPTRRTARHRGKPQPCAKHLPQQAAMTANPAAPRYGLCGLPDQVCVCALLFLPSGGLSELGVDPRRAASSSLRWERSAARRHSSPSSLRRSCRGTTATPRASDHAKLIKRGLVSPGACGVPQ
jgi:hypothetical protein